MDQSLKIHGPIRYISKVRYVKSCSYNAIASERCMWLHVITVLYHLDLHVVLHSQSMGSESHII